MTNTFLVLLVFIPKIKTHTNKFWFLLIITRQNNIKTFDFVLLKLKALNWTFMCVFIFLHEDFHMYVSAHQWVKTEEFYLHEDLLMSLSVSEEQLPAWRLSSSCYAESCAELGHTTVLMETSTTWDKQQTTSHTTGRQTETGRQVGRHRSYNRADGDLNHPRQTTDNFTHHRQTDRDR